MCNVWNNGTIVKNVVSVFIKEKNIKINFQGREDWENRGAGGNTHWGKVWGSPNLYFFYSVLYIKANTYCHLSIKGERGGFDYKNNIDWVHQT